jgi:hypothetical protein
MHKRQKGKNIQKWAKTLFAIKYKGGFCKQCNVEITLNNYDFHHTDPNEKESTISNIFECHITKIKKELDKCILLCPSCHRKIHMNTALIEENKIKIEEIAQKYLDGYEPYNGDNKITNNDKDAIVDLYVNQKKSCVEIGELYNCSNACVKKWLVRWEVNIDKSTHRGTYWDDKLKGFP